MSLNPRDLTQGGQVAFMRLKMFLQINNLISCYVIIVTVLFGLAVILIRMSIQNLTNGITYWFVRMMSPFTEKMVSQPVYTIRYYEHNLQYSARQVLNDNHTVWCGQSAGEDNLDAAMQASRFRLMSDAWQAVSLAIPRAQQGRVHLSEVNLLAEAVKSGERYSAVAAEIDRQKQDCTLIALDSVDGAGTRVLVPRVAYEIRPSSAILRKGKRRFSP